MGWLEEEGGGEVMMGRRGGEEEMSQPVVCRGSTPRLDKGQTSTNRTNSVSAGAREAGQEALENGPMGESRRKMAN